MKPQRSFYVPPSNLKLILALVIAASFTFASARATAATLPPGFVEAQVAGNLSGSPTAMAFAPDGRLFVCQQGGQLRVIKNGSLLSTPFVSLTVDSSGERGLRDRLRPELRHQSLPLRLLHGCYVANPQPGQPVYCGGRHRRTWQSRRYPGTQQSELRHQPQRRCDPFWAGRQALHRRWGERQWRKLTNSFQPAREDVAHQFRWQHPDR